MRLCDRIAQSTKPLCVLVPGCGEFLLPSAAAIAADVRKAPLRYVLDDDVAALAMRTALGGAAQIVGCLDLVRMPAPLLWIEWRLVGALTAMAELGIPVHARDSQRVGLLVRADPAGRRGEIAVAWENAAGEPDLSPMRVVFDLDAAFEDDARGEGLKAAFPGQDALTELLSHVRFRLRKEWDTYLRHACDTAQARERALLGKIATVAADFPFLAAFCLVMQAKNALAFKPSALQRLNAARTKANKAPLMDHIEVSARIGAVAPRDGCSRALSARSSARLHFVCGHLVRRGATVFWRRAHLRGAADRGFIATRTVSVRTAQQQGF